MNLSIGFSTCPNDTFIFDALVNGKIDTGKYTFNVHLADVEELNKLATSASLDISKLSYRAYFDVFKQYGLLRSGGALGMGCGPLLIAKTHIKPEELSSKTIAIPGEKTTAHFLLSSIFPDIKNKKEVLFSEVEDAVLQGEADAGLIIHENRFTYEEKGLTKLMDLGDEWEKMTHSPIPLGCIAILRRYGPEVARDITLLIQQSLRYAWSNPENVMSYVKAHAASMAEDVMMSHIRLYVNNFSEDIGQEGEKAISCMASKLGMDEQISRYMVVL
jgi:1,4-dihydroxy-6-naphthoate synthase